MASTEPPPFELTVDEEGHVLLSRREWSSTSVDLGAEAQFAKIVQDFFEARDSAGCR